MIEAIDFLSACVVLEQVRTSLVFGGNFQSVVYRRTLLVG